MLTMQQRHTHSIYDVPYGQGPGKLVLWDDMAGHVATEIAANTGGASSSAPTPFTVSAPITARSLVIELPSGSASVAHAGVGSAAYSVVGVTDTAAALVGDLVDVHTVRGQVLPVLMDVVPAASSNGQPVYLSSTTPGAASTTPPAVGTGSPLVRIGVLHGADGATFTPTVLFAPTLIAASI